MQSLQVQSGSMLPWQHQTTKDKKSRNALKAKLRRLCEMKKNDKLQVPSWLHKQWKESHNHLKMAMDYQKVGFDKDFFFFSPSLI